MARVHIMMATYNGEKFIKEQINSILKQTYTDWKLFISDDNSEDNTISIIEDFCKSDPDRIEIISTDKKGGAKKNFIYLFDNCPQAELYMFSDQDDVWLPEKIEKMVKEYDKQGKSNSLIYCDAKVVDSKLNVISKSFIKDIHYSEKNEFILMNNYIPGCVMMIDDKMRSFIGTIPNKSFMHDWWLVLYATFLGNIIPVNDALHLYRQHEWNAIGAKKNSSFYKNMTVLKEKNDNSYKKGLRSKYDQNVKRLKKRKKQNSEFFRLYKQELQKEDSKIFTRFIKMCNSRYSLKSLIDFLKYFKVNNTLDNMVFASVIFKEKL